MKRIFLMICMLFTIANISIAADFSKNPNVQWVTSNSECSVYIDKKGLEYSPLNDTATFYLIENFPAKGTFIVSETNVNFSNNTIHIHDSIEYSSPSKYKELRNNFGVEKIRPNTWGESIKNAAATLVNRDEKLAEYQKEQKDKQKKDKVKKVADSVLGGLGGLF